MAGSLWHMLLLDTSRKSPHRLHLLVSNLMCQHREACRTSASQHCHSDFARACQAAPPNRASEQPCTTYLLPFLCAGDFMLLHSKLQVWLIWS
jgi:hypothetical protein